MAGKENHQNLVSGTGTRTERVVVTPEQASQWLQLNTSNRPMSLPKVKRLSGKMKAGGWVFTHQGIGFGGNDRLIDGQHRLAAIIDFGRPVAFNVTWGLDEESFYHIDTGGTRTAADLLAGRCPELKNRAHLCAIANSAMRGIIDQNTRPEKTDIIDFVEWYGPYLVDISKELRRHKGALSSASIGGSFMAAIRGPDEWRGGHGGRDPDTVMLSLMRYAGMEWSGNDDPMSKLFRRVLEVITARGTGNNLNDIELYSLTTSALRADLQGKTLGHLQPTTVDWGDPGDHGQRPRSPKAIGGPG